MLFAVKLFCVLLSYVINIALIQIRINYKNKYTLGPSKTMYIDIKVYNIYKVVHCSIFLLSVGNQ